MNEVGRKNHFASCPQTAAKSRKSTVTGTTYLKSQGNLTSGL